MKNKIERQINLEVENLITNEEIIEIAKTTKFTQRSTGKICPVEFLYILMFKVFSSNPLSLGLITIFLTGS